MNQKLKTRVDNMISRLHREDVCMHGFILSVGGEIKATAYYEPFEEGKPHRMYSVSKTMTALAVGMLAEDGKLSLGDHIVDYFRDYLPENPDGRLMRQTIRDMLRMSTCHRATAYKEGVDHDWAKSFFTVPPTHEPGTVFNYDTGCSQVLAALVKRISGKNVLEFLQERLWGPIGAEDDKFWLCDPSGVNQGGTGLCMSLRDMHRTAQVMMDGGRGLIPAWFLSEMTRCQITTEMYTNEEERYGYGWQCWRTRCGWAMYGLGGQLAIACPDKDVLLCTIADTRLDPVGVQRIYNAFFAEIYPYIGMEDMSPSRYVLKPPSLLDDPAFHVDQAGPFFFEENPLKLRSVELRGNTLIWENDMGRNEWRFGLGGNIVDTFPGWPDKPTLCSGGWIAPGMLRIRCHLIDHSPSGVDMLISLKGDCMTVHARRASDYVLVNYEGVASGYLNGE